TQPIPTPVAWYANRLPIGFLKASTTAVLGIELFAPFLILGPRHARLLAFGLIVGLQALVALTGNYTFFNLLAAALCLFLLDDAALDQITSPATGARIRRDESARARRILIGTVAFITVPLSL